MQAAQCVIHNNLKKDLTMMLGQVSVNHNNNHTYGADPQKTPIQILIQSGVTLDHQVCVISLYKN